MSTLVDPVGSALQAGEHRVGASLAADAASAGRIFLDEIDLFVRIGDPVALAVASAVHSAASEQTGSAASVIRAALDAYARATDPDLLPPGVFAF